MLKVEPEELGYCFVVRTPLGKTLVASSSIGNVPISIEGVYLMEILILILLDEFDIIFGMD